MLVSNHDNLKFKLTNLTAFVINNNSKVYIDKSTNLINNSDSDVTTITINKGNTVNKQTILNGYDIVYGNSVVLSNIASNNSLHEYLIDYNFPAARYKVNGYKTNYAILLNNGIKPFWTSTDRGVLLGDIAVDKSSYIPTRLNGFTATISTLDTSILDKKYNGTIKVGNIYEAFDANFVYNLQVSKLNAIRHNRPYNFSNIEYLKFSGINDTEIILKNVSNALLQNNSTITLYNSNISTTKLNRINSQSYNTTVYLNIKSVEYLNYILSGISYAPNIEVNRNIFFNNVKYLHQTLHAYNSGEGYNSNLPIGSVVWWPEVWTGFSPTDINKTVISKGDPNSYDWLLCDGRTIPADSLYTQIYGLSTTPNYRVDLLFYLNQPEDVSGHHYLTLPSLFHSTPINVITGYPIQVKCAPLVDDLAEDNLHKTGVLYLRQKLYGNYDLQLQVLANWRMHAWVTMQFQIDLDKIDASWTDLKTGDQPLAILFDSYCCYGGGSDGYGWWNCWNGGYLTGNSKNLNGRMPSSVINGLLCLGGYPIDTVRKGNSWIDTRNTPKLALKLVDNSLFYIKCVNDDPNDALRQFVDTLNKKLRASYDPVTYGSCKNIKLYTGAKGSSDGRYECHDIILTNKLPYLKKRYQLVLKPNAIRPSDDILTVQVMFQMALPTTVGALRSKQSHTSTGPRWPRIGNRDNTLNSAPYHQLWEAQYMTVMNNVKLKYQGMTLNVIPNKPDKSNSKKKTWKWGYKLNIPGTKINIKSTDTLRKDVYYTNQGLYRRLNPYIKIDEGKGLRLQIVLTVTDEVEKEVILDGVNVIKVRNDYLNLPIEKLNTDKVANNMLSSCYIPSDGWQTLKDNIIDFDYIISKELLDKCPEQYEDWKIQYNNYAELQCNCNIYKNDEFTYILLKDKNVKNLFDYDVSIPMFNIDLQDLANETIDLSNVNLVTFVTEDVLPDVTMKILPTINNGWESRYYYKQQEITNVITGDASFSAVVSSQLTEIRYNSESGIFVKNNNNEVPLIVSSLTYYYNDSVNITDAIEKNTNYFVAKIDGISRYIYYNANRYYYKIIPSASLIYTNIDDEYKRIYYFTGNNLSYYYYMDGEVQYKITYLSSLADTSSLFVQVNLNYRPVVYYNDEYIIDVTSSVLPLIHYYYNEDITNIINGTSFYTDNKHVYYNYLDNDFFTKENGVLSSWDSKNKMHYYLSGDTSKELSSIVHGSSSNSVSVNIGGINVSLKYLSAYGMYYYKISNTKVSANVTNYIKENLQYYCNNDVTSSVNGLSFRYYDGDEWRDVYYDIFNNLYYYKNVLYNYKDYNTLINTLKKYYDMDVNSTENQELSDDNQIEYTYYSISTDPENTLITILPNSSLIQLASNYKKLENEIYYIQNEAQNLNNKKVVTTTNKSIPVFFKWNDENLNGNYDKEEDLKFYDVWNDGEGLSSNYCFLGTNNQVMGATTDLTTFQFKIDYNTIISGLKTGTIDLSTTVEKTVKLTTSSEKTVSSFIWKEEGATDFSYAVVDNITLNADTIVKFDDLSLSTLIDIYNSDMLKLPKKTSAVVPDIKVIGQSNYLSSCNALVDGLLYIFSGAMISNNEANVINKYVYDWLSSYVLDLSAHLVEASAITTISGLSSVEYENYISTISSNRTGTLTPNSVHPLTGI